MDRPEKQSRDDLLRELMGGYDNTDDGRGLPLLVKERLAATDLNMFAVVPTQRSRRAVENRFVDDVFTSSECLQ